MTSSDDTDEMIAMLCHELRTPMTAVLGWIKMLRKTAFDQARIDKAYEIIERNTELQARLLDEFQDVTRLARGKLALAVTDVELAPMIHAVIEEMRPAASIKKVGFRELLADAPLVKADAVRIKQALSNIIENAVACSVSGGTVSVELRSGAQRTELNVTDAAADVPASENSAAPRADLNFKLTMAKRMIEMHKGSMTLETVGLGQNVYRVRL